MSETKGRIPSNFAELGEALLPVLAGIDRLETGAKDSREVAHRMFQEGARFIDKIESPFMTWLFLQSPPLSSVQFDWNRSRDTTGWEIAFYPGPEMSRFSIKLDLPPLISEVESAWDHGDIVDLVPYPILTVSEDEDDLPESERQAIRDRDGRKGA